MKRVLLSVFLLLFTSIGFAEQAVLLVSLGMPDNALRAYLKQGKQYHVPVVIRGLYTDKNDHTARAYLGSFGDTANRVKALMQNNKVGGVSIDPLLFRAFAIQVVPALVIYDKTLRCIERSNRTQAPVCAKGSFDVVFGNLPIKKLLSRVVARSSVAARVNYARQLLVHYRQAGDSA